MIKEYNTKKHILLITPFAPPNVGGAETHLKDLYDYLLDNGYSVTLLTYQPLTSNTRGLSYEERQNLRIYRYRWYGNNLFTRLEKFPPIFNFLYLTPYLLLRSLVFMSQYKNEVDIIHGFGLSAGFILRILKMLFKKPIILSMEALYNFRRNSFFGKVSHWTLRNYDYILVGSLDSKRDVLNLGLPEDKIVVYTHWVDLKNFKPDDKEGLKKQLGWINKFTVLYAGRLIPPKGISLILEIVKRINKDIQFKIIGDEGPELPRVKKAEKEFPNIKYIGRVSNEKIGRYLAAADLFVYPALYEEDLARVLLEAMACGTPVINTNKGSGIYQLNEKVAFIVAPKIDEIQDKIEYLYTHPDILREMSKESVVFAQKFGPYLAKIITDCYQKI